MVVTVRRGKGRRDRQVPVQPEVSQLLLAYLADTGRRLGGPGPLFRAHDDRARVRDRARLSTRAIGYLVRKAMERAGLAAKAISPHSLRHTYAIRALRVGDNVIAVQKLLGHASVATTQRYLDHLASVNSAAPCPGCPCEQASWGGGAHGPRPECARTNFPCFLRIMEGSSGRQARAATRATIRRRRRTTRHPLEAPHGST